jgi:polyisoprenoid-binding protein YceI
MITTVTGYFRKFDCEVISETEDFNSTTSIKFTADIDSIETNNEQRDTHLKSEDFFNAEKYGQVIFVGTKYDALNNSATLYGNLTVRGITKPIRLDVDFAGLVVDPYGQKKAGFTVNGRISRKEFELKWNAVTEGGSVVVSDEVKIHAEVQLVKQQ